MKAAAALLLAAAAAAQGPAALTTLPAPPGMTVHRVIAGDVDGDGRGDLVVAAAEEDRSERRLLLFRRRPEEPAFPAAPDATLRLPPDVVGFAVGDVHADPGAEVILFTARGAFAWRPAMAERGRVVRLVEADFLWQLPDRRDLLPWPEGVRDLDGDGRDDLLLPEPGGYFLAFQDRQPGGEAAFARTVRLPFPAEPRAAGEPHAALRVPRRRPDAREMRVRFGPLMAAGGFAAEPLLAVEDSLPAPQLHDWDGDGDLDLLARSARHLYVWRQEKGAFPAAPDRGLPMPVEVDRGRALDLAYGAHLADLDGDGRVDCVLFAGDRNSRSLATQVLVYTHRPASAAPLFGEKGVPAQLLVLAGLGLDPELADVDGDGRPDLVVATFRPDAIDLIRSAGSEEVAADLHLFRNEGGRFARRPGLTYRLALEAKDLGGLAGRFLARFAGDLTGDGLRELLLRDRPGRLRALLARRAGETLELRPWWELAIPEEAEVSIHHGRGRPELILLERKQLVHVRFP